MAPSRLTYADLALPGEELHRSYEQALAAQRLGAHHPPGAARGPHRTEHSPLDGRIAVGHFTEAHPDKVHHAVATARAAQPAWAGRPWTERLEILEAAAERISAQVHDLAVLLTLEIGKTRLEAIGEAEEAAEFFRYYSARWRADGGFERSMAGASPRERTRSVLRPHGVWAVIAPFNFPLALIAGPAAAALAAGNTVVVKAAEHGYLAALRLRETVVAAGVPAEALHVLLGDGPTVGAELVGAGVDGITFTGSYDVGTEILRRTAAGPWPRPVVCEMGGKNTAIVTRHADLDAAAEGIVRSAFGFGGQKCSSCSRVLVQHTVHDDLVAAVVERAARLRVGDPRARATDYGPVIDERAAKRFTRAVESAAAAGSVLTGGARLTGGPYAHGVYLEPTVVAVPRDEPLWQEELFLPLVAVSRFDTFEDALAETNATRFGLSAGLFSHDEAETAAFLDGVHCGVVYVNRPGGATTGAWPGMQPFGGWKGSGSTGRGGGGEHYTQLYVREQSRTLHSLRGDQA
ncbi:aldehyde dehydrogenase family protein [Streptomyces sp. NPDC003703]|uniref:aldehyde dehydrogenase family protein n=1 Tax=Streptomyces sp. NPDC003283 TaxID=3364681 RepID=UPI0036BD790A